MNPEEGKESAAKPRPEPGRWIGSADPGGGPAPPVASYRASLPTSGCDKCPTEDLVAKAASRPGGPSSWPCACWPHLGPADTGHPSRLAPVTGKCSISGQGAQRPAARRVPSSGAPGFPSRGPGIPRGRRGPVAGPAG